jgi:hypothetical protein
MRSNGARRPDRRARRGRVLRWAALLPLAWAAGCAGYRLGTTLPPGVETVQVPTFVNRCGEPLIESEATVATVRELQKDGTLRVAAAETASSVLSVTLTDYRLEPLRFERDRPKATQEYRLLLTADVEFKRTSDGAVLVRRKVEGESTFVPEGGLSSAKQQALPGAAADLAHNIVKAVVEYW